MITREDVIAAIREANVTSSPDTLRNDVKLSEQGVDSLGLFNVLLILEEKLDIKVPDADIEGLVSIQSILDYLNRARS